MTLNEMLLRLHRRLGISTGAQDELLTDLLADANALMLAYLNRAELPAALENAQCQLAVLLYNRLGMEGERAQRGRRNADGGHAARGCAIPAAPLPAVQGGEPMRPRFRASTVVYAARYAPTADALGSMQPGYAAARHALRGTLLPSQDGADPTAAGLRRQEELVLLLPLGADIAWQDGIYLSPDAARPDYRVAALERYPLHLRARLERVAGHGG